jgi:hypothetical protein
MKKIVIIVSLVMHSLYSPLAEAQSYKKALSSQKVIINFDDHTIVAYTKPTGKVSPQSDRYYYWLSGQSINVTQGGFSGKLLNGSFESFYLNKNLKESGSFASGLKNGEWNHWNDQGVLIGQYVWKAGKKSGKYINFNSAGEEIEYGSYKDDLLDGKQVVVSDTLQTTYYKQGKVTEYRPLMPRFVKKVIHPFKSAKSD